MFLNNQQVTEEIRREVKKFPETNDNENTTTQNLWDAAKAVLREMLIAIQSYLKMQEKHQIDKLTLYLKQLEKEQKPYKLVEGKNHKNLSRNKWKRKERNKRQWKHNNTKPMGCSKSSSKRVVYSNIILLQETRKTSNR